MSNVPSELKYVASHEWLRLEDDGTVTVGITDHAQEALGDIVYVELPDVGDTVAVDDEVAVVESVKAASDVYAPLTGEVVAINEALEDDPEVINTDPYGEGWMYRIKPDNADDFESLLSAEEYQAEL
ncbi:glycine cleavage system protein H [Psychrobacter sp. YP14]|jgi:glycine cleavage system H protein|uniref:Glycine cleavage system H protein n=3 Tax=Psychrobacter TaxID=497 RepID=GCSH_PSYWF|nr:MULTISPECIES: glycine cleavage system protein GcvH [Psychrobacter]A5WG72.1 RecName: Full=Glycine cleavage system H protein [Psychrobacter sp. PRwf-1]AWT49458.1 glycine cleavage system protein H [Psychrobacter sp. YP14]MUG32254.1 glycine cleavage system protein GcvH [Psychrobacter sanguinis]UNK04816.1 glycine cleavage system protein GcvH [Psychrobacter sp. PraFG1]